MSNGPSSGSVPGGGVFGKPSGSVFGNNQNTSGSDQQSGSNPGNLFGKNPSSSATQSGLFGSGNANGTSSSGEGLFGRTGDQKKSNTGSNIFGGLSTPSKSSGLGNDGKEGQTPSLFSSVSGGAGSSTPQSKPLFGANPSTTPAGPPPSSAQAGLFGTNTNSGSGLFNNSNTQDQSSSTTSNIFANKGKEGSSSLQQTSNPLFGGQNSGPESSQQPSGTSLFGNKQADTNVTPSSSGPPPFGNRPPEPATGPTSSGPTLFGNQNHQATSTQASGLSLFANKNVQAPSSNPASGPAPLDSNPQQTATPTTGSATSPFGSAAPTHGQGLFGGQPANTQQQGNSLFGNSKPSQEAHKPAGSGLSLGVSSSQPEQGTASKPAFSTSSTSASGAQTQEPAPTSTASEGYGLFGVQASSAAPSNSLFARSAQQETPASTAPSAGLLKPNSTTGLAASTGPNYISNNSNQLTSEAEKRSEPTHTTANTSAPGGRTKSGFGTSSGLGNSTAGPPPSTQSRLKNKSMDEIITKWASDLSKYQKEFQAQAEKVAQWDRTLVENSNAISKLYSKTFQAERDTAEVQKQLSAVENHQDELEQWLDKYEREVDEMMPRQLGQGEGIQGPDQERERTCVFMRAMPYIESSQDDRYKTAEQVSERLGEMGKDLTSMIEEINSTSAAINKTSKPDDPVEAFLEYLCLAGG